MKIAQIDPQQHYLSQLFKQGLLCQHYDVVLHFLSTSWQYFYNTIW